MKFAAGDVVNFDLSKSHGTGPDSGVVIGYTFDDVCVVADAKAHGMPINEAHCTATGETNCYDAAAYRSRYEHAYGQTFIDKGFSP